MSFTTNTTQAHLFPSDIVSLLIPSAFPGGASHSEPNLNVTTRRYLLMRYEDRGLWLPFRSLPPAVDQRPLPTLSQQLDSILVDVCNIFDS